MARVNLTDRAVAAAKAEPGQRLELWDERTPGLCLRVTDRGVKTWIVRYRVGDRQPRLTLGTVPAFGLKHARDRAVEILREVARGADPATERRQARAAPKATIRTFNDLADRYEEVCASGEWKPRGKSKKTSVLVEETGILRRNVRPVLGGLPFGGITRSEVKALLRKMHARGVNAQTNRTQAVIRQVYAFAISEELAVTNPATGFAPLAEEKPRVRIYKDDEIKTLWQGLSAPAGLKDEDGQPVHISEGVCIALKLAMLLGQRRNEIIGMEVAELDLGARTWLIPAGRMKGSRPHMVPLPDAAVALIERAMDVANISRDTPSAYVFPTSWTDERAVQPDSMTRALAKVNAALGIKGATLHDLRRTVSTNLTSERCAVSPFIRSKILGHIDAGGGALISSTVYDSNTYLAEKRRALDLWADLLLRIVGEKVAPSNVTALRG